MHRPFSSSLVRSFMLGVATLACACGTAEESSEADEGAITSNHANVLEISFEGSVLAERGEKAKKAIATQLMYLQGALTSDLGGNAQAGMPTLLGVEDSRERRKQRIRYSAKIAVALPKYQYRQVPERYEVVLPMDMTKLDAFNQKYDGRCGKNEYGVETFWHDWNPKADGCSIDADDVLRVNATLAPHPQATQGKYPEYDKVWEDDSLDVVAVFGIISSNTPSDSGVRGRETFLSAAQSSLQNAQRTETATRGTIADSTVTGSIMIDGRERRVSVTGILVQEAKSAGSAFDARFASLTTKADLVIYDGHSGLGTNINALAKNMGATAGKYQLVYLYGCQTLAYLGPEMHAKRTELNGQATDPDGTKFLDVMATAVPAYDDGGRSNLALYNAMLAPTQPKTFNDLLDSTSSIHLTVVFGEHDNTFEP